MTITSAPDRPVDVVLWRDGVCARCNDSSIRDKRWLNGDLGRFDEQSLALHKISIERLRYASRQRGEVAKEEQKHRAKRTQRKPRRGNKRKWETNDGMICSMCGTRLSRGRRHTQETQPTTVAKDVARWWSLDAKRSAIVTVGCDGRAILAATRTTDVDWALGMLRGCDCDCDSSRGSLRCG